MRRTLTALLIAWLAAVVVIAITRASAGVPQLRGLASTPELVAHGRLWTLLSSALPVSGLAALEIAGLAITLYAVWRIAGIGAVWVAGLAAHIGSTLLVYAGLGGLWLAGDTGVERFADRLDYGISAIWLGELGYLTAVLWSRNRRAAIGVGAASLASSLAVAPLSGELASAEHIVALAIGLLVPSAVRHVPLLQPPPFRAATPRCVSAGPRPSSRRWPPR